ncbi:hypothetical protein AMAG_12069 [Allomyces macrogynus ATCC 38327]|uniref:Cytochrome c oxidase subunit 8, mitochondrial n=1 Tax=Allomyces macrogynus (strain ATCC 38327) TaxID=578462 RepID=A0A0L0SN31_ALLM3|nr:hypothetical protein GGF32_000910 [Allomyces javanicus]KAJ3374102.1 hypothetical protein GGF31_008318 [Allomyces arbusculus]KNE63908.1 hypothetical protein AMAG_08969 [Allomyces macrogynus ATCC 38327]KNE67615.1 hypothetical protein AMAG_12069 [Allomyces macrogynus ATCC 38327]|eukprot:KNE63908.1 hypothetical protein AMAG_08969 [Allomyces macrogynus ATCC 38327]
MFSVLRTTALRTRSQSVVRSGFNPSNENFANLPFDVSSKFGLAVKMTLYLGAGFGAPFFGAWFQLKKGGAI